MLPISLRTLPLLAPLALLAACGPKASDQPAEPTADATPAAVSTEWTAENPTEPAVPVTLPTTRVTNVPATTAPTQ